VERTLVGLIGGLSWESTSQYYRRLNVDFRKDNPWRQPRLLIDSLDLGEINPAQAAGDAATVTAQFVASAQRLQAAGCTHLAICANTGHAEAAAITASVRAELIDIRLAVARGVHRVGGRSLGLLATRYCIEREFYVAGIEGEGITVVRPTPAQTDALQGIIFDELCVGIVSDASRRVVVAIADDLRARGADVIGLCCTELDLLVSEADVGPCVDSLDEHVRAILDVLDPPGRPDPGP
jgi:aspartate racemase